MKQPEHDKSRSWRKEGPHRREPIFLLLFSLVASASVSRQRTIVKGGGARKAFQGISES